MIITIIRGMQVLVQKGINWDGAKCQQKCCKHFLLCTKQISHCLACFVSLTVYSIA